MKPRFLNAFQIVLIGFLALIAVGTVLLSLPFAQRTPVSILDNLFTAASAVCVTGLVTVNITQAYTRLGQLIIILLVQIGGLGYMTLFSTGVMLIGNRMSLRDRLNLQQISEQPGGGLANFIFYVVVFSLIVEFLGGLLFALSLVPEQGWITGGYQAFFYAISAFNNAGFVVHSQGSVSDWWNHPYRLLLISGLVILGGLGYNVNQEVIRRIFRRKPDTRWNTLIIVVLASSLTLLIVGTIGFWLIEGNNPSTLGTMPWYHQFFNAFFLSVQPRAGGFTTVAIENLHSPSLLITMVLMFIGGGPGGTAGGVKLTTAVILGAAVVASLRGSDDIELIGLKRRVGHQVLLKAVTVLLLSLVWILVATLLLMGFESAAFVPLLFEVVSAYCTVGLSMGLTAALAPVSKIVIIATMLAGRVGILVILLSLIKTRRRSLIHYPEEPLLVG